MVDPIRTGIRTEKEAPKIDRELAMLEMEKALRAGDIHAFKARLADIGISLQEFNRYMDDQYRVWKGQVLQDSQVYAGPGAVSEPDFKNFTMHNDTAYLSDEERGDFRDMIFKAATVGKATGTKGEDGPLSPEELADMAGGTLNEWEDLRNTLWDDIFTAQMMQEYEKQKGEAESYARRIIALVKSGAMDAEFALLAIAKVNVSKNGALFMWKSKEAFMTNQRMNDIASELNQVSPTDFGRIQQIQSETRSEAFSMQMLMADMQKLTQNISSTLESVHGMIGMMKRMKDEIIQKFAAR